MKRTRIKGCVFLLLPGSTCHMLRAQETSKDISATVPALTEFHKVIHKMWHAAWPNRDTDMVTALLPEIERTAGRKHLRKFVKLILRKKEG